jgi:hypothetical protein
MNDSLREKHLAILSYLAGSFTLQKSMFFEKNFNNKYLIETLWKE